MPSSTTDWIAWVLGWLALQEVGLGAVFVVSLLAATVLPLGSEPFVAGYVAMNPGALWATVAVATLGNTLGGITTFWIGRGAHDALAGLGEIAGRDDVVMDVDGLHGVTHGSRPTRSP